MSAPAVFLDRDGTINERAARHCYVEDPGDFRWLPGAIDAIAALAHAGFVPVVVSNQRGVARGMVSWEAVAAIEHLIQRGLAEHAAQIAAFSYCPHDFDEGCSCRKPRPGMLLDSAERLNLDLAASWMIGDSPSDVLAGIAAGCRTALIGDEPSAPPPTLRVASLIEAADLITRSRDQRAAPEAKPATSAS